MNILNWFKAYKNLKEIRQNYLKTKMTKIEKQLNEMKDKWEIQYPKLAGWSGPICYGDWTQMAIYKETGERVFGKGASADEASKEIIEAVKNFYREMSNKQTAELADLRNSTYDVVNKYLYACGWTDAAFTDSQICYLVDPIHGQSHRADFAWFIQTERDIAKMHTEHQMRLQAGNSRSPSNHEFSY